MGFHWVGNTIKMDFQGMFKNVQKLPAFSFRRWQKTAEINTTVSHLSYDGTIFNCQTQSP